MYIMCLIHCKDKIKVYVVPLNKLELGFWYLAPSPAVPVDGVMWEDVVCQTLWWGIAACPKAWTLLVPKIAKLYFRLLFCVYSFKVKSKV